MKIYFNCRLLQLFALKLILYVSLQATQTDNMRLLIICLAVGLSGAYQKAGGNGKNLFYSTVIPFYLACIII